MRALVQAHLQSIEEALRGELERYKWSSFYSPLSSALEGGKRIRPLLLLLSSEVVGGKIEDCLPAAVAIELLHTESLIHDDIIDQETLRRGRPSFHIIHGLGASILTADFVFAMILDIASRYRDREVAQELANAALRMCEGEYSELRSESNRAIGWEEYLELIGRKTASLFEAAAGIGAVLGGVTEEQRRALRSFGWRVGIAYQLLDDSADLKRQQGSLKLLLSHKGEEELVNHLKELSKRYILEAKRDIDSLPDGPSKELLLKFADSIFEGEAKS